jgi:hypothetical protein
MRAELCEDYNPALIPGPQYASSGDTIKEIMDTVLLVLWALNPLSRTPTLYIPSDNPVPDEDESGSEESNDGSGESGEEGDDEAEGSGEENTPGGDGSPPSHPGGDPMNPNNAGALDHYCNGRSNVPTSLDDLDQRAVETNCEDAVVNPNPAATGGGETNGEATFIDCSPEVEGRAQDEEARSLLNLLTRHGEEQDCGPTETPGPGGQCSGFGRKFGTSQGTTIWIGWGDLIGIELCDPKVCQ